MLRGGDDLAKVFCASTGYGTYNILYSIYDHYLPIYLSTYLHTRTWNLIFFFLFVLQKHLANDRRSATTDPACIIQYSIMCLVTVHQWSRQVRGGGHCSNGEYRFIASPSSVFSEQLIRRRRLHRENSDFSDIARRQQCVRITVNNNFLVFTKSTTIISVVGFYGWPT